jgi:predicted nucleotidyltransferase
MQDLLKTLLAKHKDIRLAILFGSQSRGQARPDSDIDLAVLGKGPLSAQRKTLLIAEISDTFGRPVDLVDLHTVGEPLLGQIFKGQRIVGSAPDYAQLLTRHLVDTADFLPLQLRILKERRDAWIP